MLRLLLLVFCAIAATNACSELQRLKVKLQWTQAFGFSEEREQLNIDLWEEIFAKDETLPEKYFTTVRGDNLYSPEFKAHAARVTAGFDIALSEMDQPDVFKAQLIHLKAKHAEKNVEDQYLELFRKALMKTVRSRIGVCFNQDAWEACTELLANGMKQSE